MSTERIILLEEFKQWILFVQSLQQQNNEIWNKNIEDGKWTIREIVSHIMLWDKYFLEEAIDKILNKSILTVKHLNFDEFNNEAKIYVKTISNNELAEKAYFYREQIINQIIAFTDEEYFETYLDGDGNPFNVTQYLKDFIWHDQHHINQIQNRLGREDINDNK